MVAVAAAATAAAVTADKIQKIKNTSHDGRKCFSFVLYIYRNRIFDYAILFTARARRDIFLEEVFL